RGLRPDGRKFQPADGAVGLQAHDYRRLHGRDARRGKGIDGACPRRQDQTDADEGRADGRRPEMDRQAAGGQGGRTDRAEELTAARTRTVTVNYGDSGAVTPSEALLAS